MEKLDLKDSKNLELDSFLLKDQVDKFHKNGTVKDEYKNWKS